MKYKYLFIIVATLLVAVSVLWGISNNQLLEPWTAVLGGILALLGYIFPSDNKSKSSGNNINQSSFFSFFNSSTIKKIKGKIKQLDFFSFGNTKKIED